MTEYVPLQRTVYYTYRDTGHVAHITVNDEPNTPGPRMVKDLYLAYGTDEKVGLADLSEPEAPATGPDAGYGPPRDGPSARAAVADPRPCQGAPALQEWCYDPNDPQ